MGPNEVEEKKVTAEGEETEGSTPVNDSFAYDAFDQLGSEGDDEVDAEAPAEVGVEPGEATGVGEPSAAPPVSSPDATIAPAGTVPAAPVQDPAQVAAAQAAAPPQGTPDPAAASGTPPAAAPSQQPGAAVAASPEAPAAPSTLDQLAQAVEANKGVFEDALATTVYKMSDDDMNGLDSDPANMIPKLLARAHVHIVQHTLGTIAQHLPGMVLGVQQAERKHQEAENEFFDAWPVLKADVPKYRNQVLEVARNFRAQNPTTSKADMIKFVGAQVMVMNGLVGQAQAAAAPPQAAAPSGAGFVPAGGGLPLTAPTKQVVDTWGSAFDQLGDENDVEDVSD